MARPRLLRYSLFGLASLLVILLIASLVLGVVLVRRPFPQYSGEVSIPGLRSTVAVQRDGHGIPQLYADNAEDLLRAQGYVQAQDQFFTMDWRRHVTSGRLSELVGARSDALASDKLVRTLGWQQVAEAEQKQLDPVTRGYLEAFSAGVNDYLTGRSASQLSLDYTVLSLRVPLTRIEPWTVTDSLAWFQAVAWQLRGDYDDELVRARVLGVIKDVNRLQELYPDYPYDRHQPILTTAAAGRPSSSGGLDAVTTSTSSSTSGSGGSGKSGTPGSSSKGSSSSSSSASNGATGGQTSAAQAAAAQRARQLDAGSQALEKALLGGDAQAAVEQARQAVSAVPAVLGSGRSIGANAWVVSGALTTSGKPLLADDPQLSASLPGVWYQMGLHCRQVTTGCPFDVSGYTFAGVPGIVVGHNARISWGLNSLGPDVTDYYLEKVDGDSYERDGKQVPISTRQETITVAGGDPVTITVRSTVHGPIVSDLGAAVSSAPSSAPSSAQTGGNGQRDHPYAVSIAWAALQPGHDVQAVFALDVAKDFPTFRAAAQLFDTPAQNFVYADVDGHIGFTSTGRIPVRPGTAASSSAAATGAAAAATGSTRTGTQPTAKSTAGVSADGSWPLPGWDSTFDWAGYVPNAELPWALDPADGIIIAANQPIAGRGVGVPLAADWDYGYRAQRIRDLIGTRIKAGHKLGVADVQAIQGDTYNPMAAQLVPLLLQVKTDANFAFTAQARDLLKGWDYTQPADSAAAAYFNAVWAALLDQTFSDELPEGAGPDGGQRWFEVVRTLLKDPRNAWWDDHRTPDVVETQAEVLRQAMIQARLRLTSILGKEPKRWEWGHLHQLHLTGRPLGDLGVTSVLHPLINRGPIEVGGGSSIVDAMGWDASSGDFDVTDAPSMRMIVDLGDLDGSRWINSTGESSHPGQAHYADQIDAWAADQTYPWPFGSEAVRRATTDTLTLKSAG